MEIYLHDHLPSTNQKSQDDESRKKKRALSIEHYIPFLLVALRHARMCQSESFFMSKIVLLTGLVVILFVVMLVDIISEIAIIIIGVDADKFADVISILSTHVVGLLKWCYCSINNRRLLGIVKKLESCHVLCQRIDSIEGYEIYNNGMEYARRHCNLFFLWWLSCCNFDVVQWCTIPLLLGTYKIYLINDTFTDRELPYIAWFPLDTHNNYNYILLYIVQIIGMFSCVFGICCYDSFYVSILIVISTQLQYINTTLIKSHPTKNKRALEAVNILKRKLRNCVDCHAEIIEFLNMFQTFVGPIMFVQCIETIIVICLLSFEASAVKLTMDEENMFVLFKLMGYFLATSIQLWCFCFFATRITHLASQIPHSVYSCGWEIMIFERKDESNSNKQFKCSNIDGLIQMIMIQAQRPIILTGGPFYTLSMETFRAILSMALSNSIMLRQLSNRDE